MHVCLKRINPAIEGFQRPTVGACRSFDIVTTDFIQILHTGDDHWVCVSSIFCEPGTIILYDSLYNDIIKEEVKEQVESLIGNCSFCFEVAPIQQQTNGSELCSVCYSFCNIISLWYQSSLYDF